MAWRDWDFPQTGVTNCFFDGRTLRSSDGAWLLVMAAFTSAPGRIYFPAGTPDPDDVADSNVDLAASVAREVTEETGLVPATTLCRGGWLALRIGRPAHHS